MSLNNRLNVPKKQKMYYSGKKKRHTQKAQLIVDTNTLEIIATAFGKGKKHDFRLYKETIQGVSAGIECLADSGYQGLTKRQNNARIPHKKSKKKPLTKKMKKENRNLASQRIPVEHVIGKLKRFRILKETYRNRRKRFGLRFNLLASIYNMELTIP